MSGIYSTLKGWIEAPIRYRTLYWGFVNQEIRGRYAGSMGGMLWSILTPLSNLVIYIFVFSVIFRIRLLPAETGTDSFVLFLLSGLLPWIAFAEAVSNSAGIFLGKANLITKVVFPLELIPIAGVSVAFFLHGLGFLLFLGYLVFKGFFHPGWLWLIPVIGVHLIFTLGLVILIGSLCVFIRDIQQFLGVVMPLWLYLTPILYPLSMVPEGLRWYMQLNPMYPFIELYRQALLVHSISPQLFGYASILATAAFAGGALFFRRARFAFADVL